MPRCSPIATWNACSTRSRSGPGRPRTPLLSSVPFASFLLYPARGTSDVSEVSQRAKQVGLTLKRDGVSPEPGTPMIQFAARRLRQAFPPDRLAAFLGPRTVLVPAPGSSLLKPDSLWAPRLLCDALVAEGLGAGVLTALVRHTAVPKSAYCSPGERPTCHRHYETIAAEATLPAPDELCVVDDILTKGATLLACASRLSEAFPHSRISVAAMARTHPFRPEHTRIDQPCVGQIRLNRWGTPTRIEDWTAWLIEEPL